MPAERFSSMPRASPIGPSTRCGQTKAGFTFQGLGPGTTTTRGTGIHPSSPDGTGASNISVCTRNPSTRCCSTICTEMEACLWIFFAIFSGRHTPANESRAIRFPSRISMVLSIWTTTFSLCMHTSRDWCRGRCRDKRLFLQSRRTCRRRTSASHGAAILNGRRRFGAGWSPPSGSRSNKTRPSFGRMLWNAPYGSLTNPSLQPGSYAMWTLAL
mmetsp:Transcript_17429/g.40220  ORF Transcript_17429/g.40220 Transcript_17429/m.40220 type:complete len:214 (+) Transcript_17429:1075-1716(+)